MLISVVPNISDVNLSDFIIKQNTFHRKETILSKFNIIYLFLIWLRELQNAVPFLSLLILSTFKKDSLHAVR